MDKGRLLCLIMVVIFITAAAYADNYSKNLIDNKSLAEFKAKVDNFTIDNESTGTAQKMYDYFMGAEGRAVMNSRMAEYADKLNVYQGAADVAATAKLRQIIIFISASIPAETIKTYIKAADERTVFVLRGTIGRDPSKIMPTINYIADLSCDKGRKNCAEVNIIIEPYLFREYSISRVPAIIIKTDNNTHYRFVGAMPVQYILDKVRR